MTGEVARGLSLLNSLNCQWSGSVVAGNLLQLDLSVLKIGLEGITVLLAFLDRSTSQSFWRLHSF